MKNFLYGVLSVIVLLIFTAIGVHKFNLLPSVKESIHENFMDKNSMGNMGEHTGNMNNMGGMWMGKSEKDENGNIIPPKNEMNMEMNMKNGEHEKMNMMNGDKGEKFSHNTMGLPEIEPTKVVKLKDGDSFEMIAEMVQQEMGNRTIKRLAYNRQIPGPIIEVEKNAKITITLINKLDVNTTLHSHGLRLDDHKFDGVPDTMMGSQPEMKPGESFTYELNFPDAGVFWYHPHIREDYTQEMGLYGNYHVTEENYWNEVDREEFLVLDDFSENDAFYKDLTNKTLMGRFGNILLINNQENFQMKANTGEKMRFYITNTANTRTFDFSIKDQKLKIVGGDIGRGEKEFLADNFIIAPAERIIFETQFLNSGTFEIQHRGKKIGEIIVENNIVGSQNIVADNNLLRENIEDYKIIRDDFQNFLDQKIDKKLRISIGMKGMENMEGTQEMRMGEDHKDGMGNMMGGTMNDMMKKEESLGGEINHDESDGIEWEDGMKQMNAMTNDKMMEWMLIDETDSENVKTNMDIHWKFKKDEFIKISIFNDPASMHPMQHPIHFHGQRFVVLTRDGKPNKNLQWKDTTLVTNGETIEILLNTTNIGKWMAHCHIAEHLHAGMMFNFEVTE